nr:methylated-DNA--[protein]-cysteine S-methyltransferase [Microlunatus panaciterrae]
MNTDGVLTGVYYEQHIRMPGRAQLGPATVEGFDRVVQELAEYLGGRRRQFTVPTAPVGSAFQRRVWRLLAQIPYGQTRTYTELALELGSAALARAVGAANGRNPLSIIIPCHRLVGSGGSLVGYAGGVVRKRQLLIMEGAGGRLRPGVGGYLPAAGWIG